MTTENLFEQQLLREHDLRHRLEVAGLNRKKAEFAVAEAENELTGMSKLFPFMGREQRAAIESAQRRLQHWAEKEANYANQHVESETELDVVTLAKIREEGAGEYLKGQTMKDFYGLARERVEVFQMRVRDFLKALGQARGAMSTGYNLSQEDYSSTAKERLQVALKVAHNLDIALSDIEVLNAEFKTKAKGTTYSKIEMPSFNHIEYEAGVRRASSLPIAQAQMEFEKTLDACEQLHDEGIGEVFEQIDTLEKSHENLMLKIVRKCWQDLQLKLLRDSANVKEIRAAMHHE